jgi:hypothetical protein
MFWKGVEMPNHVENDLFISGDTAELRRFLDGLKVDEEGCFSILKSYYPMPEGMVGLSEPVKIVETQEEIEAYVSGLPEEMRGVMGRPVLKSRYEELVAQHGTSSWYEWALSHWGTKWGDYDAEIVWGDEPEPDAVHITFLSAWSPPAEGMAQVASLFPELSFSLYSYEAGMAYQCGQSTTAGSWWIPGHMGTAATVEARR